MLSPKEKLKIIQKVATHEKDTGSPEVQVSLLSEEIERLTEHFKKHKKDFHSKRGLLTMVAKRRKLLEYLKNGSARRYNALIEKLGLKK